MLACHSTLPLPPLLSATLGEPEERVYAGWQALGYHDAQAGYVCGIFPRRGEVRLVFEHGASLADPDAILTGSGHSRHDPARGAARLGTVRPPFLSPDSPAGG